MSRRKHHEKASYRKIRVVCTAQGNHRAKVIATLYLHDGRVAGGDYDEEPDPGPRGIRWHGPGSRAVWVPTRPDADEMPGDTGYRVTYRYACPSCLTPELLVRGERLDLLASRHDTPARLDISNPADRYRLLNQ